MVELLLPTFSDEELAARDTLELTDLLVEHEDRVPYNLIAECARRGDEMSNYLGMLHQAGILWGTNISSGIRWMQLHFAMILGLIGSEQAGLLLVEYMRRISQKNNYNLQDWLSGCWPVLFLNKPDSMLPALHALSKDRDMDSYTRANAMEAVMAIAQRQGNEALEDAVAWLADIVADESVHWDLRLMAGEKLLKYPRTEYRSLLNNMADKQIGRRRYFNKDDVRFAYAGAKRKPDRFINPWQFYDKKSITRRLIVRRGKEDKSWRLSGEEDDPDEINDPFNPYSYAGAEPRASRNDPCPCGSNKKYKKCCLAKG